MAIDQKRLEIDVAGEACEYRSLAGVAFIDATDATVSLARSTSSTAAANNASAQAN
jgi:hypothetical protein